MRRPSMSSVMGYLTMWFYLAVNVLMESLSIVSMWEIKEKGEQIKRADSIDTLTLLKGDIRSASGASMMGAAMSILFGVGMAIIAIFADVGALFMIAILIPIALFTYFIEKWRTINGMHDAIFDKISLIEFNEQKQQKQE